LFTPTGHRLTEGTREEAHAVALEPDKVSHLILLFCLLSAKDF
jgi:hypothetical protein